jgi:hypothetical protein
MQAAACFFGGRFHALRARARGNDLMLETTCSEPALFFNNKLLLLNPIFTDFVSPLSKFPV